ncbi:MAG: hypothetical protein JW896_13725 [Deltaproteobacteria bacterium]|nr:hypothetical protein [Deltaproteobacteria bacterium]
MMMNTNWKYMVIAIVMILTAGFVQNATARDLIIVASKTTQETSMDWLGFLKSKEIPMKIITPDSFSEYKEELYIVVLGSINESKEIAEIAEEALTAEEFQAISNDSEGKMFFKPQAWNVGQKVILFLGSNPEAVTKARKSSRDEWFEMLKEWFEIEENEGFHVY